MSRKKKKSPERAARAMQGWLAFQAKVQRLDVINVALKMYDIPFSIRYVGPKKLRWAGDRDDKCYQYKFRWWETNDYRNIRHAENKHFDTEEEVTAHAYAMIAEKMAILEEIAVSECP